MPCQKLVFPVLTADIGGTYARFSLLEDNGQDVALQPLALADYPTIEDAIASVLSKLLPQQPHSFLFAIAAPIEGGKIKLTNASWLIDAKSLQLRFQLDAVMLVNDFTAQALAIPSLRAHDRIELGAKASKPHGTAAILGPGTGLGVSALLNIDGLYYPLAGEGGHIDFAVRNRRDFDIINALSPKRVSAEDILSGRGLVFIYHALCALDHVNVLYHEAHTISLGARNKSQPQAVEALGFFLNALARFAGDLALLFNAKGGVYVTGGIMPQLLDMVDHQAFRAAFEDKCPHQALLHKIPVFIITHPQAALLGLAAYAYAPQKFLIDNPAGCNQEKQFPVGK